MARREQQSPSTPAKEVDESVKESFPASDPPASHLPDEPPANAQDKWRAANEAAKRGQAEKVDSFANPEPDKAQGGREGR